jgi:hypothetical protein
MLRQQSLLEGAELLLLDDRGTALASVGATEGLHKPGTSVTRKPVFTLAQTGGTVEIAVSGPHAALLLARRVWCRQARTGAAATAKVVAAGRIVADGSRL